MTQRAILLSNDRRDHFVVNANEAFFGDSRGIMPVAAKKLRDFRGDVLVDLEAHYAAPGMKGMTSSRARSAA